MNPLSNHAHLFANGKFKVKTNSNINQDGVGNLIGFVKEYGIKVKYSYGGTYQKTYESIEECTLIARPISDMTEEECREISGHNEMPINKLREYLEAGSISDVKIPMLSIGVYPFDQSHFEDGIVINSRTL